MGRIRTVGICMVVLVAAGALGAGVASAEIPELGRCVKAEAVQEGKKTVYHGNYSGKNCIKLKTGKGKYEFLPGPGANNEFYGVADEAAPELVTVGGRKIVCSIISFKGKYTGPKTETVKLSASGCEEGKRPCQSNPAKEGEIEPTSELEGELGTIAKGTGKPTVGWDLKHEGVIVTFMCGKLPELGSLETVEGSVIGALAAGSFSDVDKMSIYSKIVYSQTGGKQNPEAFEGLAKDTLLISSVTGKTSEQTGLAAVEETTSGKGEPIESEANQEPLEVKAKTK